MAYDSLKALIRQYIKTNGEQEITGQILQNVLIEMVNQYPSTDGYATQSWVTSQLAGYATTSQLADYLPLTGGTLSGNLTVSNAYMCVVTADNSSTSYTTIIRGPGIEAQMMSSGTPIYRMVLDYSGMTFYNNDVAGTTITRSSITSGSFIKSGGTAAQFLKADGSVDSNTYVTSSVLSGYLPLTGGTLQGVLYFADEDGQAVRGEIFGDEFGLSIQVAGYGILSIENKIETDNTIKTEGFIKRGGTSAQFLKADGSVDSNTYLTSASLADYLPLTGGTITGNLTVNGTGYFSNTFTVQSIELGHGNEINSLTDGLYNLHLNYRVSGNVSICYGGGNCGIGTNNPSYKLDVNGSANATTLYENGTSLSSKYLALTGGTLTGNLFISSNGINRGEIFGDEYGLNIQVSGQGKLLIENAIEADSTIKTAGFIKSGGTSAQFLKADGSVDSNTYITLASVKGNLSVWNNTAMAWGTLTAANGYTIGVHASSSDGGDWGMCYKGGQISMQLDGWYYQNEGRYRVVDTSDLASYNPTSNFKTINNQSIIGTGNINIEGGGGGAYYDAEVEYLEATGTQWIDTGIDVFGEDKIYFGEFSMSENMPDTQFFGVDNSNFAQLYCDYYSNGIWIGCGGSEIHTPYTYSSQKITIKVDSISKQGYVNNALIGGGLRNISIHSNLLLCKRYAGSLLKGKIYSFKVLASNDQPILDLIPVRVGNVGYMYDKVSGELFGNSGTGSFVLGPDVSLPYDAEIEYLESSGTQWINTQYIPTTNTKAEMRCNIKPTTSFEIPFGSRQSDGVKTFIAFARYSSNNTAYYAFAGSDTPIGSNAANYNNDITITLDSSSVVFGNSSASVPSGRTLSSTYPIYLFNLNENNSAYDVSITGCSMKLYSFRLYENNTLVRDFIPVRVGNVGYLYDKVSGELFGNAGTGDFVLGQDTGPGGGLPYLPLTGGTITGNLTVNGAVKFNSSLTFANDRGIYFGTYKSVRIMRDSSRLLIVNEAGGDIIIGDYDDRNYTSIVNDLAGWESNSAYILGTQTWYIFNDGTAQFKTVSQTSDLRKKTIKGDVPMNLYNVANAPLFKFTWKDEKKYSGQHIGSAAQYWQTVLPELVSVGRDADMTLAMQYDVIALASAITVAKTVVNHEERIILLERENEALKKEIADLKSA